MPAILPRLHSNGLLCILVVLGGMALLLLLPLAASAQTIDMLAAMPNQAASGGASSTGDVIPDASGNLYVTGRLYGPVNFGVVTLGGRNSGDDFFIAKRSPTGAWLWAVPVRGVGTGHAGIRKMVVDGNGNVFVTGQFRCPGLVLGPFTFANFDTSPNVLGSDIFVAMLDTNGGWQWAKQAGGIGDDLPFGLALARTGALTVAGTYGRPGATFGTTTLSITALGQPTDVFVAQLATTGQWNWAVRGGGAEGYLVLSNVALDRQGNAYLAGSYTKTVQLGTVTLPFINTVQPDVFVAQISPSGTWLRANTAGGLYDEISSGIALDGQDNVYLAGYFGSGTMAVGPFTLANFYPTGGKSDVFVAKLGADNQWKWASRAGGAGVDEGFELAVDSNANVYVQGQFTSPMCTLGTFQVSSSNVFSTDIYMAKLDGNNGRWEWAIHTGGTGVDYPGGLSCNDEGTVYFGGGTDSNPAVFGPFSIPNVPSYPNGFIGRLHSPTVRVDGGALLCSGSQLTLTASTGFSLVAATGYLWSTGATTPTVTVSQPGTYTVTTTFADGQHSSARHVVTAIPTPTVRIDGDTVLCPSSSVSLTAAAGGALAYLWSTGATTPHLSVTQPGTYTVTASYGAGCSVTATKTVRALAVRITGSAQLCAPQGSTTTLVAAAAGATTFRWNTGATTASITVQQPGTYSVVATFPSGCSVAASQAVAVPQAAIQGDSVLCLNKTLQFAAVAPGATSYLWSTGATTPTVTVSQPGLLTVVASYPAGCTSHAQVLVRTAPLLPTFSLGADTVACEGQSVQLGGPAPAVGLSYRWSDGSTGSRLTVRSPGTFSLLMTSACEARTVQRTVSFAPCLTIPNVITPNGDAQNERFVITGLADAIWHLDLFNRWGQRIYQTSAYQNEWGAEAKPGIYYYLLQRTNSSQSYKGWVEVIR